MAQQFFQILPHPGLQISFDQLVLHSNHNHLRTRNLRRFAVPRYIFPVGVSWYCLILYSTAL